MRSLEESYAAMPERPAQLAYQVHSRQKVDLGLVRSIWLSTRPELADSLEARHPASTGTMLSCSIQLSDEVKWPVTSRSTANLQVMLLHAEGLDEQAFVVQGCGGIRS